MNELMPYLGWLFCGLVMGAAGGVGCTVLFAVWFSRRMQKKEQEDITNNSQGLQCDGAPPYYTPN